MMEDNNTSPVQNTRRRAVEIGSQTSHGKKLELLIVGAGGHAKVVADAALAAGHHVLGFVDDIVRDAPISGTSVLGTVEDLPHLLGGFPKAQLIVAVGDNAERLRLVQRIQVTMNPPFGIVIHPSAVVSCYASIQPGTVIMAGAVVNTGAKVGAHAVINTSCSVDHDCMIGSYAHLSPGVHLAGGVSVGEGAHLGVGVSVIPSRQIGAWAVVGAGAAVVNDIPARIVAFGVPAVFRRKLEG